MSKETSPEAISRDRNRGEYDLILIEGSCRRANRD
jgi:hypothetical protein